MIQFSWNLRLSTKGRNLYLSSLLCEVYTFVFFAIIAKCNFSCSANCSFYIQMNIFMLPSFIIRLCKFVFCEAPPPLLHGREDESHRRRSRAYVSFAKRHPPPFARLAGGDEFLRARFRLWFFAHRLFCPGIFAHEDLLSSNFCLELFACQDFYVFEFLP